MWAVFSHSSIDYFSCIADYINLAAKLTESPSTEYSLLDPAVPTTPVKANPVAIPILQPQFILYKYSTSYYDANIALAESS